MCPACLKGKSIRDSHMLLPKSVSLLFASTTLLLSTACGMSTAVSNQAPSTTEVALDNEFALAPGQSASLPGLGLLVRFDSVSNDSRCPTNVTCVWAGNAVVLVSLTRSGTPAYQTTLNSTVGANSTKDGNETISLVGLLPVPDTRHPFPKSDYRARFVVKSGS